MKTFIIAIAFSIASAIVSTEAMADEVPITYNIKGCSRYVLKDGKRLTKTNPYPRGFREYDMD